jgi:hypothetical protein
MVVKEFPIKNERACFLIPAIFFIVYFWLGNILTIKHRDTYGTKNQSIGFRNICQISFLIGLHIRAIILVEFYFLWTLGLRSALWKGGRTVKCTSADWRADWDLGAQNFLIQVNDDMNLIQSGRNVFHFRQKMRKM